MGVFLYSNTSDLLLEPIEQFELSINSKILNYRGFLCYASATHFCFDYKKQCAVIKSCINSEATTGTDVSSEASPCRLHGGSLQQ